MRDLFVDLYSYRQRENRDPLEDWLTECLAAAMRVLPRALLAEFLAELSGQPVQAVTKQVVGPGVQIFTQYQAGGDDGRPDIVVTIGDEPWIVFENKVSHGLNVREGEGDTRVHQLQRYADWLERAGVAAPLPRAIVFVSHLTPAPADFRPGSDGTSYHGFQKTVLSWGRIGRRLLELTRNLEEDRVGRALATAFYGCLEEHSMSNEFPDSTGFAALELHLANGGGVENLVNRMWKEAQVIADAGKISTHLVKAYPDYGCYEASRYVQPGAVGPKWKSFVATGIWYPDLGLWWEPKDLGGKVCKGPQVYLSFSNDYDEAFSKFKGAPEGWERPSTYYFNCKALSDFSPRPDDRAAEIIGWVALESAKARAFLLAAKLVK